MILQFILTIIAVLIALSIRDILHYYLTRRALKSLASKLGTTIKVEVKDDETTRH